MRANFTDLSSNAPVNTLYQACSQHLRIMNEEVIHINKIAEEMRAKALTGELHLSADEAANLLASCIGAQVILGAPRKIFSKLYKDAEQSENDALHSPPLHSDSNPPYSADEISKHFWDLMITP